MGLIIMVILKIIISIRPGSISILLKIFIMVNGKAIVLTVSASFTIIKELFIKGNGSMIYKREKVMNIGRMVLFLVVFSKKGSKYLENLAGLTKHSMRESLLITNLKEMVTLFGKMGALILVTGRII